MMSVKVPELREVQRLVRSNSLNANDIAQAIQAIAKGMLELKKCCEELKRASESHDKMRH